MSAPGEDPLGPARGCILGIFFGLFILAMIVCFIKI